MKKLLLLNLVFFSSFAQVNNKLYDKLSRSASKKLEVLDFKGVISDFNEMIKIKPGIALDYFQRGSSKYWTGDFNGCVTDMELGLKIDKNEYLLYLYRAMANIKLNKFEFVCSDLAKTNGLASELLKKYCK